ncbi:MAG: formylglycine-generating enzyme family protein [Pirellulaceae bacterium]|nr:formylglycine-generating enzyme family protein [Pirellulaceae bacterium]
MLESFSERLARPAGFRQAVLLGSMGIAFVASGALSGQIVLWLVGAVLMVAAGATIPRGVAPPSRPIVEPWPKDNRGPARRPKPAHRSVDECDPDDTDGLIEQMLAQNRHALLLRPQIAANLNEARFTRAVEALQTRMALVPDGEVTLGPVDEASGDEPVDPRSRRAAKTHDVMVKRFFLDRYPVTNREYFEFVAAGGYRQASLWDEAILPAVLDFVDRTGEPGPHYWKEGCFLEGTEDEPVVGVCWHEAMAYARWVGKRLPSDAEWVKAGAWPVPMANNQRLQRKYPWGDDMDRARANLWESGPGHVVGVHEFAEGVSVGGVYQLIGNVWEWINSPFHGGGHPLGVLSFKTPMKTIRGGAFDSYFDTQATCQFQSGDSALARKRNIGFRLAIGVCDLVLDYSAVAPADRKSPSEPFEAHSNRGEERPPLPDPVETASETVGGTRYDAMNETAPDVEETIDEEVPS